MKKKQKPYWEMNTNELAEATREFDSADYHPPAVKPTRAQLAQLRKWRERRVAARMRLTLSLERRLVEQADDYAATHGVSFSEVVADALRRYMKKKSA